MKRPGLMRRLREAQDDCTHSGGTWTGVHNTASHSTTNGTHAASGELDLGSACACPDGTSLVEGHGCATSTHLGDVHDTTASGGHVSGATHAGNVLGDCTDAECGHSPHAEANGRCADWRVRAM